MAVPHLSHSRFAISSVLAIAPLMMVPRPGTGGELPTRPETLAPTPANPAETELQRLRKRFLTLARSQGHPGYDQTPQVIDNSEIEVRDLALSPDGKHLAIGRGNWATRGQLTVWDLSQCQQILDVPLPRGVASVEYSPDGRLLALSWWNTTVEIRDASTFESLHRVETNGHVARIAFSPDSRSLAFATEDGLLKMIDTKTWKTTEPFGGPFYRFQDVGFSPDGARLVAGGGMFKQNRDGQPGSYGLGTVFDVATGKRLFDLEGHKNVVAATEFSPDGTVIVTTSFNGENIAWDAKTGKQKWSNNSYGKVERGLVFHPDPKEKSVFLAGANRNVYQLNYETGAELERKTLHEAGIMTAVISPDGATIYTGAGGDDNSVRHWSPDGEQTGLCTPRPKGTLDTPEPGLDLAVAPDRSGYATVHEDGTIRLRNLGDGRVTRVLTGHADLITRVVYLPDAKSLLSTGYDQTVIQWDVATGEQIRTFEGHENWVNAIAVFPDGKRFVTGSYDRTVRVFDIGTGEELQTLSGHRGAVRGVAVAPDGKTIYSAGSDRTIRVWRLEEGSFTAAEVWTEHTGAVRGLSLSPDGTALASGAEDGLILVRDAKTGAITHRFEEPEGIVWSVMFTPDGKLVASGGLDGSIRLWSLRTKQIRQTLEKHDDTVTGLAFVPDTDELLSTSYDALVLTWTTRDPAIPSLRKFSVGRCLRFFTFDDEHDRLWVGGHKQLLQSADPRAGTIVKSSKEHAGGLISASLSPDRKHLVTGDWAGQVVLWDAERQTVRMKLPKHSGPVRGVAFSRDGSRFVTTDFSGATRCWKTETGEELWSSKKTPLPPADVAFAPDDSYLVVPAGDWKRKNRGGAIYFLDAKTGEQIGSKFLAQTDGKRVNFSPDGKRFVVNAGRELYWYETATRRLIKRVVPGNTASDFDFLTNTVVVIGGRGGFLNLLDLESGETVVRLAGYSGNVVMSITISPDRSGVITSDDKGNIKIFPLMTKAEMAMNRAEGQTFFLESVTNWPDKPLTIE